MIFSSHSFASLQRSTLFLKTSRKALSRLSSDRARARNVLIHCDSYIQEIDQRFPGGEHESCPAVATLRRSLVEIKHGIQLRQKRGAWVKAVSVIRLDGHSEFERLEKALDAYQRLAALWGTEALTKVQRENKIMNSDLQAAIGEISCNLAVAKKDSGVVEDQVEKLRHSVSALQTNMEQTSSAVQLMAGRAEHMHIVFESMPRNVTQEVQSLRAEFGFHALRGLGYDAMDRGTLDIKLNTLNEYLQKLRSTGSLLSDLEVWELAWDFIEIYRAFGTRAIELLEKGTRALTLIIKLTDKIVCF